MKARAGKLKFDRPSSVWLDHALATDSRLELLALSPRVAIGAADLEWQQGDPADRFIVATAQLYASPLATCDTAITDSGLVRCVRD